MGKLNNRSKIDLSDQGLTEIPNEVFECKNLKVLKLSGNKLKTLPKELYSLRHLKVLDISKNEITSIYSNIESLINLKVLNLNGNRLKSIPKQVCQLYGLEKLLIADNKFVELPEGLNNLKNLRYLNVSNNNFAYFPNVILDLEKLERLWLNNMGFDVIPIEAIKSRLTKLRGLYLFGPNIYLEGNPLQPLFDKKGNLIHTINLTKFNDDQMGNRIEVMKEDIKIDANKKHKIFVSYSHKDSVFKDDVEEMLMSIKNIMPEIDFNFWIDTQIPVGSDWFEEIESQLNECSIAIMIVSQSFLASEFIMKTEVPKLLKKLEEEGIRIIPIIARRCLYNKSNLRKFQAINKLENPLASLDIHQKDLVYYNLGETITKFLGV